MNVGDLHPYTVWWTRLGTDGSLMMDRVHPNSMSRSANISTYPESDGHLLAKIEIGEDSTELHRAIREGIRELDESVDLYFLDYEEIYTDIANVHTKYVVNFYDQENNRKIYYEMCAYEGDQRYTKPVDPDIKPKEEVEEPRIFTEGWDNITLNHKVMTKIDKILKDEALDIAKDVAIQEDYVTVNEYRKLLHSAWVQAVNAYVMPFADDMTDDATNFALDALDELCVKLEN